MKKRNGEKKPPTPLKGNISVGNFSPTSRRPGLGGGGRVQQLLEINLQQDPPLVAAGMPLLLRLKAQVKKCVQFFCSSFTV